MKCRSAVAALLVLLALPAFATAIKVSHDPEADFTRYRTYAWNLKESLTAAYPEIQAAIVRSVEAELEAKGLHKVDLADADLQVVTFVIGETLAGSVGGFYRNPSWSWGFITSDARVVTHGALVIDLHDPSQGRPVWHAVAEKTVTDPNKAVRLVEKVTKQLFASFPPGQKKK